MERGNLSRRGFLQRSLAGLVAAGLPIWYARELTAGEEERAAKERKTIAANDRILMGAIGVGGQGTYIMNRARGKKGVHYVAVCDVDANHRQKAASVVGKDCAQYKDFRELLDRKDINAVTIGTPDHWHALIALYAMKQGKDVYCEKPLTLTVAEGQALVKVARAGERVFQVGTQQRSDDPQFRLACELVRNGRLGKLKTIETWIGAAPKGGPFKTEPVPPELDWDFWLGQTPKVDYVKQRCHYEFRWWYEYSGGKMTDWGAHHNDIAQWALDKDHSGPISVEAEGEEPSKVPNCYNVHPTFKVTYTYDNDVKVLCLSKENGVRFEGEDGKWLFVSRDRRQFKASDPKIIQEPLPKDAVRLEVSTDHMKNFMDCLRSRKRPICDVEVGHRSVTVCHIGVIALRTGKKLKWDPEKEHFDDEEANQWLSRPMREPWKLET
jgi:predicted dehydrogenase